MTIFSSGTSRELAKFCLDISKLTATAAFITPYFTGINVKPHIILGMATVATLTFVIGLVLHRITDHQEGKDA